MPGDLSRVAKPRLLFLSPVVPAVAGNGLAMRAAMVLRLLAQRYRLSLLVVQLYAPYGVPVPAEIGRLCRDTAVIPAGATVPAPVAPPRLLPRWLGDTLQRWPFLATRRGPAVAGALPRGPFDVVHVYRLALLPFARPWLGQEGPRPERHLDMDDLEPVTRRRVAGLYRLSGNTSMAHLEELEARRSEALEAELLRDFDRVYVCSRSDKEWLEQRTRATVCVLPNALPFAEPLPPKRRDAPFTFLFVGTLGYYPNEDGVRYFCTEVAPLLRGIARQEFRVTIVGTGATPAIHQLAELPEVQLAGAVPKVEPWYRDADAIIVPIRAGGGTRIKVLEAFRYGRPVVSTSIGIEGIEAEGEEHVLLGDTPAAFADQCRRLMDDRFLAERLTRNAHALFTRAYTTDVVARHLAAMRPAILGPE